MDYSWIDQYLQSKKLSVKDFKVEWNATRYMINNKMFAMIGTDNTNRPIISLKCEPAFGESLREQYKGKIIQGYYLNKTHWNSVYLDSDTADDIIRTMADQSYTLVLSSFSKKIQKELLGDF